jgi:transposase
MAAGTRASCQKAVAWQRCHRHAVGKFIDRYKVAKHFDLTITDTDLVIERRSQPIDGEALLDGIYVVRTNVTADLLDSSSVVRAYEGLSNAERAFRSLMTVDIEIRPIHHRPSRRVRAHVMLCMLAYYLEWHMRQALKPSCSTITTRPRPRQCGHPSLPRQFAPRPPRERPRPIAPTTICRGTASNP